MSRLRYQTLRDIAHFPSIPNELTATVRDLARVHGAQDLALKSAFALDQESAKLQAQFLVIESLVASSLKGSAEELAKFHDRLRSIACTSSFLGESHSFHGLEEFNRRIDSIVETFQQSFASTLAIQESFNRTLTVSLDFQKELSQLLPYSLGQELNRLAQVAASLPVSEIRLSPEGVLSIGDESLPIETVKGYVEEILAKGRTLNFQEILLWLLTKAKIYSPSVHAYLGVFLLGILVNLATPSVEEYLIEHGYLRKREVTKAINENVTRQVPAELLKDLRFVKASELKVRESPSKNSPRVGVVYFSEVLRIVKEKKDWTLVEHQSEDGEVLIRGWVYTRYLAKFKTRVSPSTVGPAQLGRLDSDESPDQFDKEFLQAAEFVLEKNEELYRRLA